MRARFKRTKRRKIAAWPEGTEQPEAVAAKATYVGSAEHKGHPSHAGPPALRSDATPCEPHLTKNIDGNTLALRTGITKCCTSAVFEGGFPKYVWTWMEGALYEARHINGPQGTYKGYRLEPSEYPLDPDELLDWGEQ